MANYKTDVARMVARCKRIGWLVESAPADRGVDWTFRIHSPEGRKVEIHRTPRNAANEMKRLWDELNSYGFAEAEHAWKTDDRVRKTQANAEARKAAEAQAEKLAAQERARVKAAGPYAGPQTVDAGWLMTPTDLPQTMTVIMTPAVAQKVLDAMNTHNRKDSASRVTYFENLIRDGEFGCTHQGGAIDSTGKLQDGQSRLQAIVNTDTPQQMQWSIGMDPKNFSRVDTGANRSARDTAYIKGEDDPATSAAAAKMLIHIDDHGADAHVKARSGRVSNDHIDKAIDKYGDELRAAVRTANDIRKDLKRANKPGLATALYLITLRLPEGDPRVADFIEAVHYGQVPKTAPAWKLRQALLNGTTGRYYNAWEVAALTIKAWNQEHSPEARRVNLVWKPSNESFPAHVFLPPPLKKKAAA